AGQLSGGWKQRLALGCAIVHRPQLLFLDEPTAGVDPVSRRSFWTMIYGLARGGVTIFVTTHYLDEAEYADRVAMIHGGVLRVLATPAELKRTALRGRLLNLTCDEPRRALPLLECAPGVREVALYGTALHVLIDSERQSPEGLRRFLSAAGVTVRDVTDIEPTLEDVFISLIGARRANRQCDGLVQRSAPLLRRLPPPGDEAGPTCHTVLHTMAIRDEASEMRTRAAVLYEPKQALAIEELEVLPPRAGEVLVRYVASGVCHSDLHVIQGLMEWRTPVVLGHEGGGVVEAVGPGVSTVQVGDHVLTSYQPSCGRCPYCTIGRPNLCDLRDAPRFTMPDGTTRFRKGDREIFHFFQVSSYAERAVLPEHSVIPIRKDAPLDVVCLVSCGVMAGAGAVINRAHVQPGSSVAVFGCGGVGLNAI